ncbi:unnamed protein product [Hermetia illucens]|uniref:Uncharacterized protein n=1 Tax=Hermetia illucens TaxID=343691 RepID=A0A7R8YSD5_HERIL|nr:uncharacterized protein LOC119648020 isoform X2 [Hermetia illucens]CAD7083476.1 unnamed protein product [Hermetia illucens]
MEHMIVKEEKPTVIVASGVAGSSKVKQEKSTTPVTPAGKSTKRDRRALNREKLKATIKEMGGKRLARLTTIENLKKELVADAKMGYKWSRGPEWINAKVRRAYRDQIQKKMARILTQLLWNLKRMNVEEDKAATWKIPRLYFHCRSKGTEIKIIWDEDHPLNLVDVNLSIRISSLRSGRRYHERYIRIEKGEVENKLRARDILQQWEIDNVNLTVVRLNYIEAGVRTPIISVLGLIEDKLTENKRKEHPILIENLKAFLDVAKLGQRSKEIYYLQAAYPDNSLAGKAVTELYMDEVIDSLMPILTETFQVEIVIAKELGLLIVLPPKYADEMQTIVEVKSAKIIKPFLSEKERRYNLAKFAKRTLLEVKIFKFDDSQIGMSKKIFSEDNKKVEEIKVGNHEKMTGTKGEMGDRKKAKLQRMRQRQKERKKQKQIEKKIQCRNGRL